MSQTTKDMNIVKIVDRLNLTNTDDETLTAVLLPEVENGPSVSSFTPGWVQQTDGWPIVGVQYRCDYRAEEEFGIGNLRKALCGTDPRNTTMLPDRASHVGWFTDVTGLVLSTRPLPARELTWTDSLSGYGNEPQQWWDSQVPYAQGSDRKNLSWMTVAELREAAKAAGVKPIPARKNDLIRAILATADTSATRPTQWPGYFRDGTMMILRADDGPTKVILEGLIEAAEAGRLGFAPMSGPFSTGVMICDTGDIGPVTRADINAQWDWYDEQMTALKPVEDELKRRGHGWYFLGNPRAGGWTTANGSEDNTVRYWLNGHSVRFPDLPGANVQPYGWYTAEELLAEKFVTDAKDRYLERQATKVR